MEVVPKDPHSCVSHSIKPTEEMFYLEHANEKIVCPDIDGFYPASVTPTVKWYLVRWTCFGSRGIAVKAMVGMRAMGLCFSLPSDETINEAFLILIALFPFSSRVKLLFLERN